MSKFNKAILVAIIAACDSLVLDEVFVNDKEEIFTSENLASLSVKGDVKRFQTISKKEAQAELAKLATPQKAPATAKKEAAETPKKEEATKEKEEPEPPAAAAEKTAKK